MGLCRDVSNDIVFKIDYISNGRMQIASNLPTILIIFGATGDLMGRKIVPALFHLFVEKKLPPLFHIIGFSHRNLTAEEFRSTIRAIISERTEFKNFPPQTIEDFLKLLEWQQGDFAKLDAYQTLATRLGHIDGEWKACANKLFYLAVPPKFLEPIVKNLAESQLTKPCSAEEGWSRVLVEKPFGNDLKTAEALDELLGKLFKEEQIYRIDHYLAKTMLQNILSFRFANNLFEPIWNKEYIEKIEIKLWETLGVEERGHYYDTVGALRDMGQNHLLQMLGLITMEHPVTLSAESIRAERLKLLQSLPRFSKIDIKTKTIRAQYAGYQEIIGVAKNSSVETYFKLETELKSERWRGVPITLESGKRLGERKKEIVVTFKHTSLCLCPVGEPHRCNQIIFSLEPTEGISIKFWSKLPGFDYELGERTIDFLLRGEKTDIPYVEEYKKILLDCIMGDQTLFNETREIKAMWQFVDPIVRGWQDNVSPLLSYAADTKEITMQAIAHKSVGPTLSKTLGIIGLGKMGANVARRLAEKKWDIRLFNRTFETARSLEQEIGAPAFQTVAELAASLPRPRVIWLMVPAGDAVEETIFGKGGLMSVLTKGDTIIDGGNSFYLDSERRGKKLKKFGIHFIDVGTSGGPAGARNGACLMIGGDKKIAERLRPLWQDMAIPEGYAIFNGAGAGHFVKMVHNGIEYGMMQAIAEGFAIMKKSNYNLPLTEVARLYNRGSVIESRLVGWLKSGFEQYGENLKAVSGSVNYTGEGEWTVKTAKKLKVPAPVIEESFQVRVRSKKKPTYAGQLLSTMRNQFGGHSIKK